MNCCIDRVSSGWTQIGGISRLGVRSLLLFLYIFILLLLPFVLPTDIVAIQTMRRYLPKDLLIHSPSSRDDMSFDSELEIRLTAVHFIRKLGRDLGFPYYTIATATVYFHYFFAFYSMKAYSYLVSRAGHIASKPWRPIQWDVLGCGHYLCLGRQQGRRNIQKDQANSDCCLQNPQSCLSRL